MKTEKNVSTVEKVGGRALVLEARFYAEIADNLYEGARRIFEAAGMEVERVDVPGSLELPAALKMAALSGRYDAYVLNGCVIRGETYHFEIVCNESARGISDVVLDLNLAAGNCVLTVDTIEQAIERADPEQMDKGGGAARAAVRMLALKKKWLPK
jgi:6,7-dimethyl-8-ribityllumazine synthase